MLIPGVPPNIQQFLVSLIMVLIFPLVPLWAERLVLGYVSAGSLMLTASVYTISVGLTSRNPAFLVLSGLAGLMYAFAYAAVLLPRPVSGTPEPAEWIHASGILGVFVIHGMERYNRHWVEKLPFGMINLGEDV